MFKKIFLFEDESVLALELKKILLNSGYEVEAVWDFDFVIRELEKFQPEIAIIDIMIGESDKGFEIAETIVSTYKIPIIFITANSNEEVFEKAKKYSPYDYLVKPIDSFQLKRSLLIAYDKYKNNKALIESESRYKTLFENMQEAFAYHEIIVDDYGKPCDYVFLEINEAFEKMTGLKKDNIIGKRVKEIIPTIEDYWIERYGEVALTGKPTRFTNYNSYLNRYYEVYAYSPESYRFAVLFWDVTERLYAEEKMQQNLVELEITNEELKNLKNNLIERVTFLTQPVDENYEPDIKELFDRNELYFFAENLANFFNISFTFLNKNYEKLYSIDPKKNVYELILTDDANFVSCHDRNISTDSDSKIFYCENTGLLEAHVEIKALNKTIGYCVIGQVKSNRSNNEKAKEFLLRVLKDENEANKFFESIPFISEEHFNKIADFFESLLRIMSTNAYFNLSQSRLINKLEQTERDIKELNDKLKLLIDSNPMPFIQTNDNFEIEYINSLAEKMFDINRTEALGKNILSIVKFEDDTLWESIFSKRLEYINGVRLNNNKLVNLRIGEIKRNSLKIGGYIFFFDDITTIEKLSDKAATEEKKFKEIFENSFSPIALVENGKITLVNSSFLELFEYDSRKNILGKNIEELFDEDYKELILEIVGDELYKEKPLRINAVCHTVKSDRKIYVEARISNIAIKETKGALFIFYDISDIKKYQELLIYAKEEAEKANRLKSDFLAQISHEIRTPVNAILSFESLLKDEIYNKVSDEIKEMFDHIESGCKRLIRTIDLIINAAQFQAKAYEISNVNLNFTKDILHPIINEHKIVAQEKGIDIIVENEIKNNEVYSDPYALTQVFSNLIDNAIKFSNGKNIKIKAYEVDSIRIAVEVIDYGVGISKEFMPYLFNPFSQEERGYTRRFEGNGLGLYNVKNYCDLLGAEIKVESEKGKGSKFTVIIPR